ncbi:MAG: type I glyceraldehyde-3-phosphate dehydrogenase [Candidatus Shikimatogenerans bostrichidophilus]|nr:MAG: type I glyceraldehyde-3-phosphate dehydrogenase [Candidatus Shikimatogenerans bostrichidophilus]
MIKIGINGFNRIGKMIFYSAIKNKNIKIVAINKINIKDLIYILKYDSIHKLPKLNIIIDKKYNNIIVNNKHIIRITNENDNLDWKSVDAKYIIETTGNFIDEKSLLNHIKYGAKKVIITYPPKDENIPIFVIGVNHKLINKYNNIIYYASSTTNCLSPILKILHREFEIIECLITIINSNYNDFNIIDDINKNYILGRSILCNIIPYKKKIYKEIYKIIPEIKGKIKDISYLVPNINNVSIVDLTIRIKKSTNYDNIKKIIKFYSKNELSGILGYINNDIVSTDILDDTRISIFDAKAGIMLNPNFFKIICWYDNEIGYSNKIINFIEYIEYNI